MYLLILFGGSETTTNLLGNGFLALQRHRDQWDRLVADPTLVPNAVEELLRYDSPHHYLPRFALEDFEIAGQHGAKRRHRDHRPRARPTATSSCSRTPTALDITPANAREHLSLAFGPHFCLGAALARLEGQIVFERLVTQLPEARLLTDDIQYGGSAMLRAIRSLARGRGHAGLPNPRRASTKE